MEEPRILAIETSGRAGSAALAVGPNLITEAAFSTELERGRDLVPTVETLMHAQGWRPRDLAQCYLSIGPGSFTGLRIGVTFARHLALACGVRICAVPSLAVIAENAAGLMPPPAHLAVVLDAKRGHVFAGLFEWTAEGYQPTGEPQFLPPQDLLAATPRPLALSGEGIEYHDVLRDARPDVVILDCALWTPTARSVHALGWKLARGGRFTPANELVPLYVRRPEAEELWEQRHGRP